MKVIYILQQIYPCILYGLVSVQLTFAMKWLLQGRQHLGLNTVLGYQQIVIVILCSLIDKYYTKKTLIQVVPAKSEQIGNQKTTFHEKMKNLFNEKKDMFIFSAVYFLNTLSGTKAHSSLPIPMFLALRRTLIFFVFIASLVLGKNKLQHNILAKASIFLITFGALFAGLQSFDDNILGYLLCFFNNSLSAISLQLTKNYNDNQNLSPYQIVVKNSINVLPFFFVISISTGELKNILISGELFNKEILFLINYVAILGFFHQFTTNLCSAKCSPLALAVTQSVKVFCLLHYYCIRLKLINIQILIQRIWLAQQLLQSFSKTWKQIFILLEDLQLLFQDLSCLSTINCQKFRLNMLRNKPLKKMMKKLSKINKKYNKKRNLMSLVKNNKLFQNKNKLQKRGFEFFITQLFQAKINKKIFNQFQLIIIKNLNKQIIQNLLQQNQFYKQINNFFLSNMQIHFIVLDLVFNTYLLT
ncbi:UDP-galactose transporter-like protein (macronuclear) [Tetrahymena thermophila SB210]|uniref:UDP-galactose transporter-like protein n=1 Tax=Tetrahymena thermophila (strain SB210) TaxID=312017 RepID=I7MHY5_TETTS|nr:UDP-galactose transporter-like protein [Tetrahymena thermophila SB210]EAR89978.2 UDP-galactose transporter-like protein [Tetrahymena thermophila SB210]|eukprot:XP_001010223.2 UDP-galactose transporter-like protein [Tetrahymena thermophila SB210]